MYRMACREFLLQQIVPAEDRQVQTGLMLRVTSGSTEAPEEMQNSSATCGDSILQLMNGPGCMAIRFRDNMEFTARKECLTHRTIQAFATDQPHGLIAMEISGSSVEKSSIPSVVRKDITTISGSSTSTTMNGHGLAGIRHSITQGFME